MSTLLVLKGSHRGTMEHRGIRTSKFISCPTEGIYQAVSVALLRPVLDIICSQRKLVSHQVREPHQNFIIPVPLRRVRTTRSSTHSHPFQVSLPHPRTLSHKSSFIPRTCNLWNVLPSCFPESYNLSSFKSKINKLDLISLSS